MTYCGSGRHAEIVAFTLFSLNQITAAAVIMLLLLLSIYDIITLVERGRIMEYTYKSPIGDIWISYDDTHILGLCFDRPQAADYKHNDIIDRCIKQLDEYFAAGRTDFDVPLNPMGTDFQQATWAALRTIPYGQTTTYGQIAAQIGRAKAARAVGMVNNRNPIYIIIPCHRVVGAGGKLVGYGGGLARKEWLLKHEASGRNEQ